MAIRGISGRAQQSDRLKQVPYLVVPYVLSVPSGHGCRVRGRDGYGGVRGRDGYGGDVNVFY